MKTAWVLVECVEMHRNQYLVEVPATNPAWAMDTVTMQEAPVLATELLGENIISHRVLPESELQTITGARITWAEQQGTLSPTQAKPSEKIEQSVALNPRLRELMQQADYPAAELAVRAQRLAQLIVKECVHQILTGVRTNPPQAEPAEIVKTLALRIQQHLGVTE